MMLMNFIKRIKNEQVKFAYGIIDCEPLTLYAPSTGTVIGISDIPDETFSSGVLGTGFGIVPKETVVVAPFDGVVEMVAPTKHAIAVTSTEGVEVLVHVGVDTVSLNGEGFTTHCKEGDSVKAGQTLLTFDIAKIQEKGLNTTIAVFVTNSDTYHVSDVTLGEIKALQKVCMIQK